MRPAQEKSNDGDILLEDIELGRLAFVLHV